MKFIKDLAIKFGLSQKPNPEIKNMSSGEGECSQCHAKIKNKQIYMIPGKEGYYCRACADEAAEHVREESFSDLPHELKGQAHFDLDHGYFLKCSVCSKILPIREHGWTECKYCHEPMCKHDHQNHSCPPLEEAKLKAQQAQMPKRCDFCGKKMLGGFVCSGCKKTFCEVHEDEEHHNCRHAK